MTSRNFQNAILNSLVIFLIKIQSTDYYSSNPSRTCTNVGLIRFTYAVY